MNLTPERGREDTVRPPLHTHGMSKQLTLIDDGERDWKLDAHTREVGRRGVAAARAALRASQRRRADDEPTTGDRHAA